MAERGRTSWSPSLSDLSSRPSPLARQPPGSSGTRSQQTRREQTGYVRPGQALSCGRRATRSAARPSGASRTFYARMECCPWLRSILLSSGWCTTDQASPPPANSLTRPSETNASTIACRSGRKANLRSVAPQLLGVLDDARRRYRFAGESMRYRLEREGVNLRTRPRRAN
jgi:hypothetical protein